MEAHKLAFSGQQTDYPQWRRKFTSYLIEKVGKDDDDKEAAVTDLLDLTKDFEPNNAVKRSANTKVYRHVSMALPDDIDFDEQPTVGDGRALWQLLKDRYAPNTASFVRTLNEQILLSGPTGNDLSEWIATINHAREHLKCTGSGDAMSDSQIVEHVCRNLPEAYRAAGLIFLARKAEDRTWSALTRALRDAQATYAPAEAGAAAFSASYRGGSTGRGRGGAGGGAGGGGFGF